MDARQDSTAATVAYPVGLSTRPERPKMTAEVVPDPAHPGMQLQLEISSCTLVDSFGSRPASIDSAPGTRPAHFLIKVDASNPASLPPDQVTDGIGNGCVPHPALGASLWTGILGLAGLVGLAARRPDSRRSRTR